MTAQYLTIEEKHRQMAGFLASLADFNYTPGDETNADIVRDNPNISLYCLDDATKRAIFVELPPNIDLATAPFVYLTQYEQAQRLIAVPYDTFQHLAKSLPEVTHLILVYISGRSGSTLLSHVFNALDTVRSFAEPDVATQFVHLRSADGARDAEFRDRLDSTVRFLCKPTPFKTPTTYALKLRNEGLRVMDLFQATFPHAKNLFLYRDAIGFIASFYRIFKLVHLPEQMPIDEWRALFSQLINQDFLLMSDYLDTGTTEVSLPQHLTLWWLAIMEWHLAQYARGIPILGVRYADLSTAREQVLTEIFTYCGLPTTAVAQTLDIFTRDSQAGTLIARENPTKGNQIQLTNAQRDDVTRILRRHPTIKESDYIAPGTLRV
jgi:sulfotransferase family protein